MVMANMHKNWWSSATWFSSCERTDRQTDRQTDMLITILHTPRRSKVKMHGSYQTFCTVSMRTLTFAVTSGFCVEAAILLFTAVTLLLIASAARYVSNPPLPTSYIQWLLIKRNILTTNTAKIFQNTLPTDSVLMPSVLWRCWLGGRKGIGPVKNWVVGCWRSYLSGTRCRSAYGTDDATATLLLQ